jgi:AraC-like DNA-binding protein
VSAIGCTRIIPGAAYPPPGHPGGRHFLWESGRVLSVFQMISIRSGCGVVEWEGSKKEISAGTVFFLLPGEWHRYKPAAHMGWVEDWVELRGPLIERWIGAGLFAGRVADIAEPAGFSRQFADLHRLATKGTPSGVASPGQLLGSTISLISQAVAGENQHFQSDTRIKRLVERAGEALREGLGVTATARALGLSYPTLHRYFREVHRMSPKQVASRVRLARAEALLADGHLSIKEIAAILGYHSASHFSLAFKRDHGLSPEKWRENG